MTTKVCSRRWEVEAARDQHLSGAAMASHVAHVAACAECRVEQEALDALARKLRAGSARVDEVALRRLRQATLERAFELSRTQSRPLRARNVALVALAAAGLAVAIVVQQAHHERPSLAVTAGSAGATWNRHRVDDVDHVDLGEGAFSLVVRRRAQDPRVIVHVPEGEIEDFGTAFDVHVHAGRTERIAVREGVVVFRRSGAAPLRLSASMEWRASERAAAPVPAAAPTPTQTAALPIVAPAPFATPHRANTSPRAHVGATAVPSRAPKIANDAANAAAAEDAAYLRVLALLREARVAEAKLAAAQYLQKFPNGFRRVELQKLTLLPDR
jgi:hypothetical protein